MRKMVLFLMLLLFAFGFSGEETNVFFDTDGNPTEEHVRAMQKSWCDYNEGRDFLTTHCDFFNE